jgi:drug/metabolite transporter (DMT)-like permease
VEEDGRLTAVRRFGRTSMTEITALYNLFAFWAYLLAVKILGERPSQLKLASVLMAIGGVIVISFGGATAQSTKPGSHPLIGDMLALLGSVSFAFYEVWYVNGQEHWSDG